LRHRDSACPIRAIRTHEGSNSQQCKWLTLRYRRRALLGTPIQRTGKLLKAAVQSTSKVGRCGPHHLPSIGPLSAPVAAQRRTSPRRVSSQRLARSHAGNAPRRECARCVCYRRTKWSDGRKVDAVRTGRLCSGGIGLAALELSWSVASGVPAVHVFGYAEGKPFCTAGNCCPSCGPDRPNRTRGFL